MTEKEEGGRRGWTERERTKIYCSLLLLLLLFRVLFVFGSHKKRRTRRGTLCEFFAWNCWSKWSKKRKEEAKKRERTSWWCLSSSVLVSSLLLLFQWFMDLTWRQLLSVVRETITHKWHSNWQTHLRETHSLRRENQNNLQDERQGFALLSTTNFPAVNQNNDWSANEEKIHETHMCSLKRTYLVWGHSF